MTASRPIEILLIEANAADVRLSQEAFQDGEVASHLSVARDAEMALAFLRREGPFTSAPRPTLILLDLELPGMSGQDLLAIIKRDSNLRTIPVIVMTASSDEKDVEEVYGLHANCYIAKPTDLDKYIDAVNAIEEFWLKTVRFTGR